MDNQQVPTFWITGYLPNGVKVSYTVPITTDAYAEAMTFSNHLLESGFTTNERGLEAGEKKDKVGYVLRRSVVNESGETPVIDVYVDHEAMTWRTVKVYLNTPEQIAEFEHVSGLTLDSLPYYEGKDSVERGDAKLGKYVTPVKNAFYAISKANPKYVEEMDKDKQKLIAKKLFVRWEVANGATPQKPDAPAQPKAPDTDIQWMADKEAVKQLVSAISTQSGLSATDILGAVNIVTGQSASRWSELQKITRSDCWAAVLLSEHKFNKTEALKIVGNDTNKVKAIEYWTSKTEDITF